MALSSTKEGSTDGGWHWAGIRASVPMCHNHCKRCEHTKWKYALLVLANSTCMTYKDMALDFQSPYYFCLGLGSRSSICLDPRAIIATVIETTRSIITANYRSFLWLIINVLFTIEGNALYINYSEHGIDASYSPVDNTPLKQNFSAFYAWTHRGLNIMTNIILRTTF